MAEAPMPLYVQYPSEHGFHSFIQSAQMFGAEGLWSGCKDILYYSVIGVNKPPRHSKFSLS
eukprot:scaffold294193_cov11-Prasinocladus_malaysianus.AAC.1